MASRKISRRQFLGSASCAALGTTTMLSSILNLQMLNAMAAPRLTPIRRRDGDYKALVCIRLAGGNDSYNRLVPVSNDAYNVYATTRSNLALLQGDLLPLNFTDGGGVQYGIHPSMPEVQQLFDSNKLSILANAGTLIEPTNKAEIISGTATLPLGLMSHADQIQQWQTSVPQDRNAKGWGGRMADIIYEMNNNQNVSMNISLAGTNSFQIGNTVQEYAIQNTGNGSVGVSVFEGEDLFSQILTSGAQNLLDQQYSDIMKQTYADKVNASQAQHEQFSTAIEGVPAFGTQFSESGLSQDLQMVAKTIAAHSALDVQRQTFFVTFGGWDHHDEILDNQTAMLAVVSQALNEFNSALEEVNMSDCVTTFTISDFARTLTSNGNGTDHAWGGNVMVMGGSVNGGEIFGEYPTLELNGDLEIGGGVMIPTTTTDEYFAELAMWFGVEDSDMEYIFPNLTNFYTLGSGNPVGFMNL
jgi:uncharacterized protein (DUF1501 family)